MAQLGQSFNANNAPEMPDFSPIPAGVYPAIITDSEVKPSKSGNNYLNLTVTIADGQYKNRLVWDILNLWHPTEKVKNIAVATLGKIQKAVGVIDLQDSSQLHNKPLLVKIAVDPGDEQYGPKNIIKGYKAIGGKDETPEFPPKDSKPYEPPKAETAEEDEIW
jgi:hypothetical protein